MHRVLLTGGYGFLGSYVYDKLINNYNVIRFKSSEYNLTDSNATEELFSNYAPDIVIHLAARVGGIGANMDNPGKFFYDNMMMGLNVIHNSYKFNVQKIVQIGTVCSYPKFCTVPFVEKDLWNGYPEETNAPYGISKKALYVMLEAYSKQYGLNSTVLIPCNLYGPRDNFNPDSSHVIPALIKKIYEAKQNNQHKVVCWGSGNATREFLYVEDAADAILSSMDIDTGYYPINLGNNEEITIRDLVIKIKEYLNFDGDIEWDVSKPDGQPRRCLDISRSESLLSWKPKVSFNDGLKKTIDWYVNSEKKIIIQ